MSDKEIASNVEVEIAQVDNSDVKAKLTSTISSITLTGLVSLIDILTNSGRSQDVTYNIHLKTKPNSSVKDYYGEDFSRSNW